MIKLVLHLALLEGDGAVRFVVAVGCRDEESLLQLGIDDHLGAQEGCYRCYLKGFTTRTPPYSWPLLRSSEYSV